MQFIFKYATWHYHPFFKQLSEKFQRNYICEKNKIKRLHESVRSSATLQSIHQLITQTKKTYRKALPRPQEKTIHILKPRA
jgi:hypothetical protein